MKTRRLASAEQRGFGQAKAQVTALGAQPAKTADLGETLHTLGLYPLLQHRRRRWSGCCNGPPQW